MMSLDERTRREGGQIGDDERPFRCPHCSLFFGWTDGRQLRSRAFIFDDRIRMRCAGCGQFYEWGPTPEPEGKASETG